MNSTSLNLLSIYQAVSRENSPTRPEPANVEEINALLKGSSKLTVELGSEICQQSARTLVIPKNIKEIDDGALIWCKSLKSVVVSGNVKKIGKEAFSSCMALEDVVLKPGIQEIGENAFANCHNLNAISIPKSVKKIGMHAFINTPIRLIDFSGKNIDKIKEMENYPWGITNFEAKFANSAEKSENENDREMKEIDTYDNGAQVLSVGDYKVKREKLSD